MLESLLKRDRAIMLIGLATIAALAWLYLLYLAWDMQQMDMATGMAMGTDTSMETGTGMAMEMSMPQMQSWTSLQFLMTFIMWSVMMVAMMVPSATPMVLTYAATQRRQQTVRNPRGPFGPTFIFLLGYLVVWVSFSALATLAQWMLQSAALLSPMTLRVSIFLGSLLLIVAGIYQFTPLKQACLHHCRTPFSFLLNEWRDGLGGAFRMGAKHGSYCLGCCWFLMALLFVAGVMNLLWVAALSIIVLLEKTTPFGTRVGYLAGAVFIGWGIWLAAGLVV